MDRTRVEGGWSRRSLSSSSLFALRSSLFLAPCSLLFAPCSLLCASGSWLPSLPQLLLRAGARALHRALGERREAVDPPEGLAAGMRPRFSTGQGRPVRKPRSPHANPSRTEARRAWTRGGLSLAYFSLATQREVGRAGRRTDRKLLLFASSNEATQRHRGEDGAYGGPGPTL